MRAATASVPTMALRGGWPRSGRTRASSVAAPTAADSSTPSTTAITSGTWWATHSSLKAKAPIMPVSP